MYIYHFNLATFALMYKINLSVTNILITNISITRILQNQRDNILLEQFVQNNMEI